VRLNPHRRIRAVLGILFLSAVMAFWLADCGVTVANGPAVGSNSVIVSTTPSGTAWSSQPIRVSQPAGSVACPKCGRVHSTRTSVAAPSMATADGAIAQTSFRPATASTVSSAGPQNVLGVLNRQRSRQGLRSLRYDAALQAVAERRVRLMARTGTKSHPPGSFAPGRYEGVGWSSSYSPSGVHACYTSNPSMTAAGAAMARGRDGVYFAVVYR